MPSMPALMPTIAFVGQVASHWRETGALVPSGKPLARAMSSAIGHLHPGETVVELGPGTGVFTQELIKDLPNHPVVAVEFNHAFASRLRRTMPRVQVIEGCASQLPDLLAEQDIPCGMHGTVGAVISGLPLLSLDRVLADSVFRAIAHVLRPGGTYVQFTYSSRAWRRFDVPGFRAETSRRVWLNVPPAVVMPFTRI